METSKTMDLTKTYPRSVHDKWLGLVQLGRTLDKGKAQAFGEIGEYHYDCPMDRHVFEFLGINADEFLNAIRNAKSDSDIEAYLEPYIGKKSPEEIDRFNRDWVTRRPQGESLEYFTNLRDQIAPERTDVTSWADLLDLDEKRTVPKREAVSV